WGSTVICPATMTMVCSSSDVFGSDRGRSKDVDVQIRRNSSVVHRRLEPFTVAAPFGPDISYLLHLVERGELDPQIGWRGSWKQAETAIDALLSRQVRDKAVLEI